ncbi:MAG: hypothetical protein CVV64_08075 [Candidatus Wallbacteria bacterium HGW-Wallbacteria-1]|uniref:Uncharacterized protein n=1 Tax=Candidatus Wallbacteria bacterium HGW-Wallbacteria-1 TaxID=2013854 RepID=A0A2N1PR78_9BACT|nr:MAG: hypothetical protein CVV64_08075 [Candidatus Wallbacteria bacterium HGW-Wallbacteria-1]
MKDLFEETMEKFIRPIHELGGDIPNEAYFLTSRDNMFVFAEGYNHPSGKLHGKIIYYPDKGGRYDYFGREYSSSFKRFENGELVLLDHATQLQTQFKVIPELKPTSEMPVHAEYRVEFDIDQFRGYFDHRHSLKVMMEEFPEIDEKIRSLSEAFDLPLNRIGATGSLSFGIFDDEDDLDLVFYGTVEENSRLLERIREHTRIPENRVVEFGKLWPIRFFYQGTLICPFFCYTNREESPARDFEIRVIRENVIMQGKICNDTHSIYFPVFLEMNEAVIDNEETERASLLIYDSSLRGEYFCGDTLRVRGRLVDLIMKDETIRCILCTISSDIEKIS